VEEFKPDPYLATLLNCMLWVFYGIPVVHPNSILVVTINGIGLVIEAIYLTIFFIYSDGKKRVSATALLFLFPSASISDLVVVLSLIPLCFDSRFAEEGVRDPGRGDSVRGRRGDRCDPGRAHPREALHDRRHPLCHLRIHDVRLPAHHHGT
jgi:hypothetical protein